MRDRQIGFETEAVRETERQTDIQTHRHIDRQTDINSKRDRQTGFDTQAARETPQIKTKNIEKAKDTETIETNKQTQK